MSEVEIAIKKVFPYLKEIGFPDSVIEGYGRVPIQVGSTVVWGDYVCYYYTKIGEKKPFAVIEVKDCPDDDVKFALPQGGSYAQMLDAPFFCITNGNLFLWYMTGKTQSDHLELKKDEHPALPECSYLKKPEKPFISPYLYEAIKNFESNLIKGTDIYEDTLGHHSRAENLNIAFKDENVLNNQTTMLQVLEKEIMPARGKTESIRNIIEHYDKFKSMIAHLRNETIPDIERIDASLDKYSPYGYGIPKLGIFFITQLLSGLFPLHYTIIEQNAVDGIEHFRLTDVRLESDNNKKEEAKRYLYFNEICRTLYPYFDNKHGFNLSLVHNFLWHYYRDYLTKHTWTLAGPDANNT